MDLKRKDQAHAVSVAIVEFLAHDAPLPVRLFMGEDKQWLLLDRILKALWRDAA